MNKMHEDPSTNHRWKIDLRPLQAEILKIKTNLAVKLLEKNGI